jgi:predicted ATP-grasp superfamily ATP-dependent carboligase
MTKEDIIRMAREAEFDSHGHIIANQLAHLERFAALVAAAATEAANARANTSWALMCKKMVAAEKEACAKVCEEMRTYVGRNNAVTQSSAQDCATAIRARGQA